MTGLELSEAWNDLRNAALGRGVKPVASAALAARVGNEYERFRSWFDTEHEELAPTVLPGTQAADWVERLRALTKEVKAEGIAVREPSATFGEKAAQAASSIGSGLVLGLASIAVIAGVGVAVALASRGRR